MNRSVLNDKADLIIKPALVLALLAVSFQTYASSGDGLSFRINDFLLKISWFEQENTSSLSDSTTLSIINLIHANYSDLVHTKTQLWFEYIYNEENRSFNFNEYHMEEQKWELKRSHRAIVSKTLKTSIPNILIETLSISPVKEFSSEVFVVFIPGVYIDPESEIKRDVERFLDQSELYFGHQAAVQSNEQGYVYSIFFSKRKMDSLLDELNVDSVIINRKRLDLQELSNIGNMHD